MYISFNDPDSSPGVFRKEKEFCEIFGEACQNNHMEFKGLCIISALNNTPETIKMDSYYEIKKITSVLYRLFHRIPIFCSIFRIRPVYAQLYKDIIQFKPDVILWRYNITSVPWIFNPKKYLPKVILVSEHQAKELDELRMTSVGGLLSPLIKRIGYRVMQNVDAILGVTSEITAYECDIAGRNISSFTMTNSIDVQRYSLKKLPQLNQNALKLLYIGSNTTAWHGLDRVLKGMASHQGTLQMELHIAGYVSRSIQRLIHSLNIEHLVFSHGYVTGHDLDALFDLADVAIGSLGMHRKNLTHGSTLKVREYMARGIPFMISHSDEDLAPDLPYVFMAPADDTPIDMHKVIEFKRQVYSNPEQIARTMRTYALEHMDYRMKTRQLMEFIKSLLPPSSVPNVQENQIRDCKTTH